MKKNSSTKLFLLLMIAGTMLTLSSNNWMMMWVGLEINMMSFIPLISKQNNQAESSMIYFLVQSLGSMTLLFSILMPWNKMFMTMMAIMMKMGAAPIHFWMIQIMEKLSWINCLVLMTWQKIAPMVMVSNMKNMMIIAMISIIMGAIGGLNQTSLRKIMAFSSINHMGWMLAANETSPSTMIKYLTMYSIIMIMMIMTLNKKKMLYLNQIPKNMNSLSKINFAVMMMSIGGLPPFMGFSAKWIVIQSMISNNMIFLMILMIMMSMVTLFFYLRISSTVMMLEEESSKMSMHSNNSMEMIMLLMNMFSLPLMTFILL